MNQNSTTVGQNLLEQSGLPLFFEIANARELWAHSPPNRRGQSVRVWARSLTAMQKEAIVLSTGSGRAWRLASDEGPYLNGHDYGPCPLSFMSTGMVSATMNEILAAARRKGVEIHDLELVQNNYYAMEGSALKGTMKGSAMPVELEARVSCGLDDNELHELINLAVVASPVHGLLTQGLQSLFTLSVNDREIKVGTAAEIASPALAPPRGVFDAISLVTDCNPGWIQKAMDIRDNPHRESTPGSGLSPEQKRTLHLRATCRLRPDGVKEIHQQMFTPPGSDFVFLSDEAEAFGGKSRAPDAVSYVSAGIAFCFMTQLGRYARILDKNLDAYDVIQDTHFSSGGYAGGNGETGMADPVETHVYLATSEGDDFARQCLDMGEQTCYLHALCRTSLNTFVTVSRL